MYTIENESMATQGIILCYIKLGFSRVDKRILSETPLYFAISKLKIFFCLTYLMCSIQ
jgi:hypothetical protein